MMAYIVCLMWVYCTHIGIARENVICYNVNRKREVNMSETTRMAFRVDKVLKANAEKVFKQMGMSSSAALNIFLTQCVREQRLPFQPGATQEEVEENQFNALLDEVDEVLTGDEVQRGFGMFEELTLGEISKDALLGEITAKHA